MDYDSLFKILLIGESGVGKSSFIHRYVEDEFNEAYLSTIGVDFKMNNIIIDGKQIKLHLWDTAGQERFRSITSSYYRNADAMLLMFDLTDRHSFVKINDWLHEIETHGSPNVKILIVGNKSDLFDHREVSEEEIKMMCKKLKLPYFETSTKLNTNIREAVESVAKNLLDDSIQIKGNTKKINFEEPKKIKGCGFCNIL